MMRCFIFIFLVSISLSFAQTKETFTYAIKEKDTLKLDVYKPEKIDSSDKLPTLLWIHGGGFAGGARDYKDDAQLGEVMAKKGWVMASVSYRLLRKGTPTGFGCDCPKEDKLETFRQAVIDYYDAANYIVEHAEALNINVDKIISGGSSAGAEIVLNAVYMKEYFIKHLENYSSVKFQGVWSLAGAIVDVDYLIQDNAIPAALFHGTDDGLVPFGTAPHHYCTSDKPGYLWLDGSETIAKKLEALEAPFYFYMVKGGHHELASIPYDKRLDDVLAFFQKTAFGDEIIQTKKIFQK